MVNVSKNIKLLGTESAFEVLARAEKLSSAGHKIINLGIGQPDFKTPVEVIEAAIKALKDGHHGYTSATGILPLREAIAADLLKRHNAMINPERIIVVPGGKPSIFFAILMFGAPGNEIMYPNPGFPIYESVINYTGATAVKVPIKEQNSFSITADSVLERITERTRLIILNSPANPTGGVTSENELDKIVAGLLRYPKIAILSDEIYSQMLYHGKEHKSLLRYPEIYDQLITLDGWSKTYAMTGWRLGDAVWPEKLVSYVTRLCINKHSCVNAPTQYAGIAALNSCESFVKNMMKQFNERRLLIHQELNRIPQFKSELPKGAFYCFANIKGTGLSSTAAQELFLNKGGVATISGTSFGSYGEGFLRLSYANSIENIKEALRRITLCF